jgi:hypothetical protein
VAQVGEFIGGPGAGRTNRITAVCDGIERAQIGVVSKFFQFDIADVGGFGPRFGVVTLMSQAALKRNDRGNSKCQHYKCNQHLNE